MGRLEVPQCLFGGYWGLSKSITYFLISNLFLQNPYNFARNGAIDSNRVFLESLDHSSFPMELSEVLYQLNGGRWGRHSRYRIFNISNLFMEKSL